MFGEGGGEGHVRRVSDKSELEAKCKSGSPKTRGKNLTFDEASRCLNTLGKDETGVRYAYLMITATDKQLTDVSVILSFRHVLFLDLSFNHLTLEGLQVLAQMPFLIYLKATNNKVASAGLDDMPYLQVLILNRNCVNQTDDICQNMLETLELEYNQIFNARFLDDNLPNLKYLNLKGNHLMDISGTYPSTLEKLYLAENTILSMNVTTMAQMKHLTHLHLRENNIKRLNGFSGAMENLQYINFRNNRISKLREFRKLQCLPKLDTLILNGNPVMFELEISDLSTIKCEDADDYYHPNKDPIRVCILVLLPRLKRINKDIVTMEELDQSVVISKRKYEEIMDEPSDAEEDRMGAETPFSSESEIKSYVMDYGRGSVKGEGAKSDGGG